MLLSFNEEPALQKAFIEYSTQEMTADTSHFESLTGPRDLDEYFSGKSLPVAQFNQPIVSSMSEADHERSASLFESLCEQRLNTFKGLDDEVEDMDFDKSGDLPSLSQTFSSSFDAKFNEVFGSPEASSNAHQTDIFSNRHTTPINDELFTAVASDPFSSTDATTQPSLFSGSNANVTASHRDPFSSPAAVEAANTSSNWADFTAFGSASQDVPHHEVNDSLPLVLQSIDASETAPESADFAVQSSPSKTIPSVLSSVLPDDDDEELGANFDFLSSSGLAKNISATVGVDDEPKE